MSTYLLAHGNLNGLRFSAENKLGAPRVEEVEFFRTAAHVGIVLLDKIPANLILRDTILLVVRRGVRGSGRRRRLEASRAVDVGGDMVEGVGVSMLRRIAAVDGSLGRVGHCDVNET